MVQKIKDLTVEELGDLISEKVREAIEHFLEDFLALSSPEYIKSIEDVREDYRKGRTKEASEVFDV